ncbi:fimbria/pilus outer membrane usher protein [Fulvimonas sp. R45]|jgi:outer membrane usher protein|uniref:fimbria/pilus outer membrane usher protein n=1 Tax=Fulvimonas sp. R45 TaxID=3045937 RepID=UPI00265F14BB|nr:fimbria/pilus outer membrane usher protein [Fulvimonas sp. R45]MDO1528965.1 fimbria/pilus outer membrane usher protein [Fulvimonas sp. R45]
MEPQRARSGHLPTRRAALAVACGVALAAALGGSTPAWAAAAASAAPGGAAADASASGGFANFDRSLLAGAGGSAADLARFEHGNPVLPGIYNLDVYLGENWIGRMDVRFAAPSPDASAVPCASTDLLDRMGLAPVKSAAAAAARLQSPGACVGLGELIPGARLVLDMPNLRLDASVPQAYMNQMPRGWVNPTSWSAGVPAFLLNYNFNSYRTTSNGQGQTSTYLGLRAGLNIGLWQLRQDSTVTWQSGTASRSGQRHWQNIDTYVQRALPKWRSVLNIGDSYTDGAVFDSYGLRGVQLGTDDRMLPQSLRGYAPVVRGVADTNAKVTVSQNGMQIYQTTVAPGAFVIDDLYPTGYGGDLDVTVTEADGRQHGFKVPYASVAQLMRPGITRFDVAVGQLRDTALHDKPGVVQAAMQHGFGNRFTGYAGVQGSQGYAAALVGGAFNTRFGALALDVTQAHAVIPGNGTYNGQSFRVTYSKIVPETNTSLSVAAYRYSTSGFLSLNDAESARDYARRGLNALQYLPTNVQTIDGVPVQSLLTPAQIAALNGSAYNSNGLYTSRGLLQQRNRFTLTLNQQLGHDGSSLYANATANDYWNHNGRDTQFQLGYNSHFHRLAWGVSVSRGRTEFGGYDNQVFFNASLPLGDAPHAPSLSFNVNRDDNNGTQEQATLNGTLGQWNQFTYGASASHGGDGTGNTFSVNAGYNSPYATLNASVGHGNGYSQTSFGASGAVVAHQGGVTFGQPTGDTVAIAYAPGAAGAHVVNAPGVRVNRSGYALVPYLAPYQLDTVQIDPQGLPLGVQLDATSARVAPYAGAVVKVNFKSRYGRALIARIRMADGKPLPFGTEVQDAKGQAIGTVGQGGMALLRVAGQSGRLGAQWQDTQGVAHACSFAYAAPATKQPAQAQAVVDATCTMDGQAAAGHSGSAP